MADDIRIPVQNEEMVSTRDIQRHLPKLIGKMKDGELEKVVGTKHGKMVCVVLTVEDYAALLNGDE